MKFRKIGAVAASAVITASALATSASAVLVAPNEDNVFLTVTNERWSMSIPSKYDIDYSKVYQLYALVSITNEEAYLADKESGFYSDGETEFVDFQGAIAVGGFGWHQFDYSSLEEAAGSPQPNADTAGTANVRNLGGGRYSFSATFDDVKINDANQIYTINFNEWGNKSSDYALEVIEMSLIGTDGSTIISYNSVGDMIVAPPIVETTTEAVTEPPVETTVETTTTTVATTTEATTTTTEETTTTTTTTEAETAAEETEASEETEATEEVTTTTTAAATTTTAEVTTSEEKTTAATTTAAVQQAVGGAGADFSERNNQLMGFAIGAGVVILIAVVGFIVVSLKKKK
ncbi:MAG: hypothetical protein IJZ65_04790 [Ruminiclostridium sp.]|nr:hypothetical protein [Ruminiclostridium sp.]